MTGISHVDAVDVLKSITNQCHLVVSREVLIVLPEDIASPPPDKKTETDGEKMASPPASEDQPDNAKTSSPENVVSSPPPPEGQVSKTSPPPEDRDTKTSPPPHGHTNTDASTTSALTVPPVVQSASSEELSTFGEQLSQTANKVREDEVVLQQVVEQLLESAPQLESQPDDNVEDQKQVEVNKDDDQVAVKVDDVSALEEFAEELRQAKEQEKEEETVNINVGSEPRDNYVNYDIAQAVIVTSPSNASIANSETSVGSGDPPAQESSEQVDSVEVVKNETAATKNEAEVNKSEAEEKKAEPKEVAPVTEEIVISQSSGTLGMNIVGGSDRSSFPFGRGMPGVFISKVYIHLYIYL